MIFDSNELARAVVFFNDDREIETEMNIAEFQAVLDGFVPLNQLASTVARACYVEFNNQHLVKKLVFFLFPLGADGFVNRLWHMPLADLANEAASSKDLGGGPVRLACRSNCPVKHFSSSLWDPDLNPSSSHLLKIKKAIASNRLGVQFRQVEEDRSAGISERDLANLELELSAKLRKEYAQEFRDHMAQLLKDQRLRMATMKTEYDAEYLSAKRLSDHRLDELRSLINEKERLLDDQRTINTDLKATIDGQAKKIEAMREYFDRKASQTQSVESAEGLKEAIEAELSARFESQSKELKERLQMREVELLYRNELEVQLHDEIARLKDINQKVISNTGEQLLSKLVDSGISLVAYHPGAGHITVPVNEVAGYLDSPSAYAADKCGVNKVRYEAWLTHYRMPVCQNTLETGALCGENIDRVELPIDFEAGESDWCESCRKKKARAHLRLARS